MKTARIYTPDVLVSETTVIVTTNHLGASMESPDGSLHGDSGRDAQHLADISGQRVIGLDRLHTGNGEHYSSIQSHITRSQPDLVVRRWVERLQPALNETGATKVELVGRSAAASFLMEVAVLELLPVTGIVAVDPLGFHKTSRRDASLRYVKDSLPSNPTMLRRHLLDIRQNRDYWLSDKATMTSALIAARMKRTKTLLAFADEKNTRRRERLEQTISSLNVLRSKQNGISPLLAGFVRGTSHRSFDDPRTYMAQYERYRELGRTGDIFTQKVETIKTDLL